MGQEESTNRELNSESADNDNKSNQRNPNNKAYWKSRGYDERPDDWKDKIGTKLTRDNDDNRANQFNSYNPRHSWSSDDELDSSTSVVPYTGRRDGFQFEIDKELIATGTQIAGLIYGTYHVHNKISKMVEDRKGNNRTRSGSSNEGLKDLVNGIEVAVDIGLLVCGGIQLYDNLSKKAARKERAHRRSYR